LRTKRKKTAVADSVLRERPACDRDMIGTQKDKVTLILILACRARKDIHGLLRKVDSRKKTISKGKMLVEERKEGIKKGGEKPLGALRFSGEGGGQDPFLTFLNTNASSFTLLRSQRSQGATHRNRASKKKSEGRRQEKRYKGRKSSGQYSEKYGIKEL